MIAHQTSQGRLTGFDVARALAMAGMVIAHYVESGGQGVLAQLRDFVDGRAMPLFMLLGGVGITFLTTRSQQPDRDLLTRAVLLLPLGLALQVATTDLAIILQYYAVFFVAATGLRRLPDRWLLVGAFTAMAAGAVTQQMLSPVLPANPAWQGLVTLTDPGLWWAILITGYYPFLPAAAFLLTGMWLARRDLRSAAIPLIVVGVVVAFTGSWLGALVGEQVGTTGVVIDEVSGTAHLDDGLLVRYAESEDLAVDVAAAQLAEQFPAGDVSGLERLADRLEQTAVGFRWQRLFDAGGHSQMPAWVIGATGSSLAFIGISLAAVKVHPLTPLVRLGQMALTFYVFQAVIINWTPERAATTLEQEYLLSGAITLSFLVFAAVVGGRGRRGPFEALLRVGSAPRIPVPG